jgi:hypothetical protein
VSGSIKPTSFSFIKNKLRAPITIMRKQGDNGSPCLKPLPCQIFGLATSFDRMRSSCN